jgi:hypothetical protein
VLGILHSPPTAGEGAVDYCPVLCCDDEHPRDSLLQIPSTVRGSQLIGSLSTSPGGFVSVTEFDRQDTCKTTSASSSPPKCSTFRLTDPDNDVVFAIGRLFEE